MIKLNNVNKIIGQLGGQEIDPKLLDFLEIEVLDILRWACYREDFPEDADRAIEYLIALKAILNNLEMEDLTSAKEPVDCLKAKSITIENTRVDIDNGDKRLKDAKLQAYKNKLEDMYNDRLEIFCSRYRCLKC